MRRLLLSSVAIVTAISVSGCVTTGNSAMPASGTSQDACQYDSTLFVAGGAVVGFALAKLLGVKDNAGLIASTAAGGLLGKGAQSYLTQRCQEIAEAKKRMKSSEVAMRPVAVANHVSDGTQAKAEEAGVAVTVSSASMFQVNGAQLSPSAEADMRELARAFQKTDRKVLIVGHTDSTGNANANQALSERRAQAVAKLFEDEGIPLTSLYFKGAGDTRPLADNGTETGRAKNRRVEVVELESEQGVVAFDRTVDSDPAVLSHTTPERTTVATTKMSDNSAAKSLRIDTGIDFGGHPIDGTGANLMASVGKEKKDEGLFSSFSLVSKAFASDKPDPLLNTACIADVYRNVTPIKSLATGKTISNSYRRMDYMPGFYSTTWTDTVNGNLVALAKVSILTDGGSNGVNPEIFVFEHYKQGDQKPALKAEGEVRSYFGEDGILYRIFYGKDAWPVRCMDIVFSRKEKATVSVGTLYYDKSGKVYAAEFMPEFIKK